MKKLFIYYCGYLLFLIILFSRKLVNIMSYRGGKLIGFIAVIMLSALLVYLTFDVINKENLKRLAAADKPKTPKRTEMEKMQSLSVDFESIELHNVSEMIKDELEEAKELSAYLYSRLSAVDNLLSETFSVNDLTYAVYKSNINEIAQTVNANFTSILKRFHIFPRVWTNANDIAAVYEAEIQTLLRYNTEIRDKIEELMLELVRLGDAGQNTDIDKLTELVKQTKDYSIVRKESF